MTEEYETFVIKCTMKHRWIPHFLGALQYMEYCGNIGRSCEVTVFADGDGDFRPKFDWSKNLKNDAVPKKDNGRDRMYDAG